MTLRRFLFSLLAALAWNSVAIAQDFCAVLRGVLAAAPTEFAATTGAPSPGNWPAQISVFEATQALPGGGVCAVAQQTQEGRRYSTSYTCSDMGADNEAALQALRAQLRQCLDVTEWEMQPGNGALNASYGLIRLSITRNGARGGLALGVEVFRDERGEVLGSPTRGNRSEANGQQRCSPRTPREITDFLAMYGARPGAERFEDRQFVGYTNRVSSPVVAFSTRPTHPAHPALIVRDFVERDGSVFASVRGDFAGDCEAFHELMREVQEMTRNLGQ